MHEKELPLVSVITPSFNQGAYIRETIESVLSQDYPSIEHIVVDGGSTDTTLEILKHYAHHDHRFRYVYEPDHGQSHAINKGLNMAKGSIIGWLNSDDTYMPGAIRKVVKAFEDEPEYGVIYGNANYTDHTGNVLRSFMVEPFDANRLFETCIICQPAAFIRKDVFTSVGGVDESLRFCMDYDLWVRISRSYSLKYIDELLATSRLHDESKSVSQWGDVGLPEIMMTSLKHYGSISNSFLHEFLRVKGTEGASWLLQRMKDISLFGPSPQILHMNRYHDKWVSRRFRIVITSDPQNPASRLRVSGTHVIPFLRRKRRRSKKRRLCFTLYVNGQRVRRYALREGPFHLDIPLQSNGTSCVVDFIFTTTIVPARAKMNADRRVLSCLINEVMPYSQKEDECYRVMIEHPMQAGHWLQQNVARRG